MENGMTQNKFFKEKHDCFTYKNMILESIFFDD